jgi:hypothetical protein
MRLSADLGRAEKLLLPSLSPVVIFLDIACNGQYTLTYMPLIRMPQNKGAS